MKGKVSFHRYYPIHHSGWSGWHDLVNVVIDDDGTVITVGSLNAEGFNRRKLEYTFEPITFSRGAKIGRKVGALYISSVGLLNAKRQIVEIISKLLLPAALPSTSSRRARSSSR